MIGGGIEIWFAYVLALVFLLFPSTGCSVKKSSTVFDNLIASYAYPSSIKALFIQRNQG